MNHCTVASQRRHQGNAGKRSSKPLWVHTTTALPRNAGGPNAARGQKRPIAAGAAAQKVPLSPPRHGTHRPRPRVTAAHRTPVPPAPPRTRRRCRQHRRPPTAREPPPPQQHDADGPATGGAAAAPSQAAPGAATALRRAHHAGTAAPRRAEARGSRSGCVGHGSGGVGRGSGRPGGGTDRGTPEPATTAMDGELPREGEGNGMRGRRGRRSPAAAFLAAARASGGRSGGGETGRGAALGAAALGLIPPESPQGATRTGNSTLVCSSFS